MVDRRTGEGVQVTVRCCGVTIQKSVGKGAIGCGIIWFGEGAIGVTESRRRDNELLASRLLRDHLSEIEGGGGGLDFAAILWNSMWLVQMSWWFGKFSLSWDHYINPNKLSIRWLIACSKSL
ncbi:hypothetical protein L6452_13317 [Arctium lappa]|uniref:Uncharacterized protein n=1 Tax=Arctium lappa TaxID=4217 RepID=A0ACB9CHT4_ARCLA|nr:hypothetical protein L6452_13317 [Arctium lappa]